jgi:glycosyltransferase involved in cell wall biosynthesis
MRIAFISAMSSHPWGGSEALWHGAALCLRQAGHQVSACVQGWPTTPKPLERLIAEGIDLYERRPVFISPWSSRWTRIRRRFGAVHARPDPLGIWLEALRPDFICISNGNFKDGLEYMERAQQAGIPFGSIVQANAEFLWPSDIEAERLAEVYTKASGVFCVSRRNLELLERQLAVRLPQAEVVRNPYQISRNMPPPWPQDDTPIRLAVVGRLEPDAKGHDLLFDVLVDPLWKSRDFVVSLFGEGSAARSVRRLAAMFSLGDRIRFEGQVSDIGAIWLNHHCLILPSRYEGLPLALVEAMISGRPSIVTDVAGNCELVEDGVSGFVAAAPTVPHLAQAMERAWQARERWPEMGRAARETALLRIPVDPCRTFAERILAIIG